MRLGDEDPSSHFEDRSGSPGLGFGGGGGNMLGCLLPLVASRFGVIGVIILLLGDNRDQSFDSRYRGPVLVNLRDATGESAQIFRRQGDWRVCVASAERPIGVDSNSLVCLRKAP